MANNHLNKYSFLISVVMPVYNTDKYLDEAISSILRQRVYEDYDNSCFFELLLIDDGSTDCSGEICDYYATNYPNVKTLHKNHDGPSSARNLGISYAKGKYITFIDSDDYISDNTFLQCVSFFEDHYDEIILVTYPIKFFGEINDYHWTNYRFDNGTRVINLLNECDSPQYFTSCSFFKSFDLKNIRFDETIRNGEDLLFVNELLLLHDIPKIGLVTGCEYYYRRRTERNKSIIQSSKSCLEYYSSYIVNVLSRLAHKSVEKYGYIPSYIQNTIKGQLQWRYKAIYDPNSIINIIGELGYREYVYNVNDLLDYMHDNHE